MALLMSFTSLLFFEARLLRLFMRKRFKTQTLVSLSTLALLLLSLCDLPPPTEYPLEVGSLGSLRDPRIDEAIAIFLVG